MKSKSKKSEARKSGRGRARSARRSKRRASPSYDMAAPLYADYSSPAYSSDSESGDAGMMHALITLVAFGIVVFLAYRTYLAWTAPSGAQVNSALEFIQSLNPFGATNATIAASAWDEMINRERSVITPITVVATLLFLVMLYKFYA
jgi:hypothetical protein